MTDRSNTEFIDSLFFPDILKFLEMPHTSACVQWLLYRETFQSWMQSPDDSNHSRLLWVIGAPCSGKTTAILGAYHQLLREQDVVEGNHLVASFSFENSGEPLLRSADGMYRTILYQICSTESWIARKILETNSNATIGNGSTVKMQEIIEHHRRRLLDYKSLLLSALRHSCKHFQRVTVFVDAIDECLDYDWLEFDHFFHSLIHMEEFKNLRICLSSRVFGASHWSWLRLPGLSEPESGQDAKRNPVIDVQYENSDAILTYIDERLRLYSRDTDELLDTKEKIVKMSQGNFTWVKSVIDRLIGSLRENQTGQPEIPSQPVPSELRDVYVKILRTAEEPLRTWRFFQWMLLAPDLGLHGWRDLIPFLSDKAPQSLKKARHSKSKDWARDLGTVSEDDPRITELRRIICQISLGLAQVAPLSQNRHDGAIGDYHSTAGEAGSWVTADGNKWVVRPVHDSVQQFLEHENGFDELNSKVKNHRGEGLMMAMMTCLDYLNVREFSGLNMISNAGIFSQSEGSTDSLLSDGDASVRESIAGRSVSSAWSIGRRSFESAQPTRRRRPGSFESTQSIRSRPRSFESTQSNRRRPGSFESTRSVRRRPRSVESTWYVPRGLVIYDSPPPSAYDAYSTTTSSEESEVREGHLQTAVLARLKTEAEWHPGPPQDKRGRIDDWLQCLEEVFDIPNPESRPSSQVSTRSTALDIWPSEFLTHVITSFSELGKAAEGAGVDPTAVIIRLREGRLWARLRCFCEATGQTLTQWAESQGLQTWVSYLARTKANPYSCPNAGEVKNSHSSRWKDFDLNLNYCFDGGTRSLLHLESSRPLQQFPSTRLGNPEPDLADLDIESRLEGQLWYAMFQDDDPLTARFIPYRSLRTILTTETVTDLLREQPVIDVDKADEIRTSYSRVLGILLLMGKASYIYQLSEVEMNDACLPIKHTSRRLKHGSGQLNLFESQVPGKGHFIVIGLEVSQCRQFEGLQWSFLSPFLAKSGGHLQHYKLVSRYQPLPIVAPQVRTMSQTSLGQEFHDRVRFHVESFDFGEDMVRVASSHNFHSGAMLTSDPILGRKDVEIPSLPYPVAFEKSKMGALSVYRLCLEAGEPANQRQIRSHSFVMHSRAAREGGLVQTRIRSCLPISTRGHERLDRVSSHPIFLVGAAHGTMAGHTVLPIGSLAFSHTSHRRSKNAAFASTEVFEVGKTC